MTRKIARLALVPAFLAVSCTTTRTPDAERVRVTRETSDVATCKSLGFVDAQPPYTTPADAENEMRNKAATLGADTLLVTNYSLKATGVAYLCGAAPTPSPR